MKFWLLVLCLVFAHVRSLKTLGLGSGAATPNESGDDELLDLSSLLKDTGTSVSAGSDDDDTVPELPEVAPVTTTLLAEQPDDDIQSLERSVLNLVNQGASPGMVTFVAEVRKLIHGKMKKELHQQHNATVKSLNVSYEATGSCSTRDWREMLNVALAHDAVNGSFSPELFKLPSLAEEHRNCRDVEAERGERVADLQSLANDFKDFMDTACALYAGNETQRLLPVGDSNRCVMDVEKYPLSSKRRHLDYLKDQLAYWDSEYNKIRQSREDCASATKAYKAHQLMVDQASAALTDVREACNEAQAKMDEASCSYKASVTKKCELIARCAESTWKTYNETLTTAKTEEIFLKAQMSTLQRIECYLGAFELSDMREGILECKGKDFDNDPEVARMAFEAREKPEPRECKMDKENVAGYCAYEGKYYANTSNLSQPCNASCCSRSCLA